MSMWEEGGRGGVIKIASGRMGGGTDWRSLSLSLDPFSTKGMHDGRPSSSDAYVHTYGREEIAFTFHPRIPS